MWQILEHRNVLRRVRKMPKQVLKRYDSGIAPDSRVER
jgi:hypothetical protein